MIHDQEAYLAITIDHLIPKKDKDENHKQTTETYINELKNKVLSCRNCNALKGDFIVEGTDLQDFPDNRESYISEVRKYISIKRSDALGEFIEATMMRAEQVGGQNSSSRAASA